MESETPSRTGNDQHVLKTISVKDNRLRSVDEATSSYISRLISESLEGAIRSGGDLWAALRTNIQNRSNNCAMPWISGTIHDGKVSIEVGDPGEQWICKLDSESKLTFVRLMT